MRTSPSVMSSALCLLVAACAQQGSGSTATAPSASATTASAAAPVDGHLCQVKNWHYDDVAAACKPGQKVIFVPDSFGNEQLPVIFAAVNCDLRYSVALTTGAVTCIYHPIVPDTAAPASASKS
ncbi:MAG: hypothetical protein JSS45_10565 [Proteobacteria bacterium]|nr:hypothetical protein [Pseudomonadota bacterium]